MKYTRKPSFQKEKTTILENNVLTGEKGQTIKLPDIKSIHSYSRFNGELVVVIKDKQNTKLMLLSASMKDGTVIQQTEEVKEMLEAIKSEIRHEVTYIEGSNSEFALGVVMALVTIGLAGALIYKLVTTGGLPGRALAKAPFALLLTTGIALKCILAGKAKKTILNGPSDRKIEQAQF